MLEDDTGALTVYLTHTNLFARGPPIKSARPGPISLVRNCIYTNLLPRSTVFGVVTAENMADMVMGSVECQAHGYLSKLVMKSILQIRLRELLDKRGELLAVHEAVDRGDNVNTLALCEEHIKNGSRHRMMAWHLKAKLLLQFDDYQTLCEAIRKELDVAWAAYMLGQCHASQEHHELAKQAYLEILQLNSNFVMAYDGLAQSCLALGELGEAEEALAARCCTGGCALYTSKAS